MNVRVYEFSKKVGKSNKEILDLLEAGGFEAKSHMSVMAQEALDYLEKALAPKKTVAAEKILPEKPKETPAVIDSNRGKKIVKPTPPAPRYAPRQRTPVQEAPKAPEQIVVRAMTVGEAATALGKPVQEVMLSLLRMGVVATINQSISEEIVTRLATTYDIPVVQPTVMEKVEKEHSAPVNQTAKLQERMPVIVVVGHVDHGKTTLLDFIRKTRVAAREHGGITQHIGAYEARTPQGNLVFLDTPGHAAFSKMRQRGLKAADIAILVVAADDGIMPQTVEAIKFAKNMHVPIIVAINKVDKVDAVRLEVVKRELSQQDLLPEDWGGETVCVPISAKTGAGIDQLLEMLVLQAQMLELRGDVSCSATGYILESKLEKGRGIVATFISQNGKISVGDYFVCGRTGGRVTALFDFIGKRINDAGPSKPVQIAGFDEMPEVGEYLEVVPKAQYLSLRSALAQNKPLAQRLLTEGAINLIVKTDTDSTKEALLEALEKLSKKTDKGFNIVASGIGDITESDVELAYNTGSSIVGLHVKAETNAAGLVQRRKVTLDLYNIIYKLLEALELRATAEKVVKMERKKVGEADVLRIFDIKNIGVIAGSFVKEGRFVKDGYVIVFRRNKKIGEGKITGLQRDKKTVKEVHAGFECGFLVDGFNEWQEGDVVHCMLDMPQK